MQNRRVLAQHQEHQQRPQQQERQQASAQAQEQQQLDINALPYHHRRHLQQQQQQQQMEADAHVRMWAAAAHPHRANVNSTSSAGSGSGDGVARAMDARVQERLRELRRLEAEYAARTFTQQQQQEQQQEQQQQGGEFARTHRASAAGDMRDDGDGAGREIRHAAYLDDDESEEEERAMFGDGQGGGRAVRFASVMTTRNGHATNRSSHSSTREREGDQGEGHEAWWSEDVAEPERSRHHQQQHGQQQQYEHQRPQRQQQQHHHHQQQQRQQQHRHHYIDHFHHVVGEAQRGRDQPGELRHDQLQVEDLMDNYREGFSYSVGAFGFHEYADGSDGDDGDDEHHMDYDGAFGDGVAGGHNDGRGDHRRRMGAMEEHYHLDRLHNVGDEDSDDADEDDEDDDDDDDDVFEDEDVLWEIEDELYPHRQLRPFDFLQIVIGSLTLPFISTFVGRLFFSKPTRHPLECVFLGGFLYEVTKAVLVSEYSRQKSALRSQRIVRNVNAE